MSTGRRPLGAAHRLGADQVLRQGQRLRGELGSQALHRGCPSTPCAESGVSREPVPRRAPERSAPTHDA